MSTPHRSKERTLNASAAEKIVIDDTVCDSQQQGLAAQASTLSGAVGPASASLGSAAFGVMNSLLVGPMNSLASRTGELASTASAFASRMSEGVGAAKATFAEVEEAAVAAFDGTEVGG
ncbi:hypothetical protein ACFSWE_15390 [Leucobacter albus]|uniref:Excreted virulence factor EspC (Type VII ESX diderm) n=1 Tax=Leucobacter albus TaxID=272210 RepID=A0ABW3TSQ4_9MICO